MPLFTDCAKSGYQVYEVDEFLFSARFSIPINSYILILRYFVYILLPSYIIEQTVNYVLTN